MFRNMMLIDNTYSNNKIELINMTSHELQRLTDIVIQQTLDDSAISLRDYIAFTRYIESTFRDVIAMLQFNVSEILIQRMLYG